MFDARERYKTLRLSRRNLLRWAAASVGTTALADVLAACSLDQQNGQSVTINYWDWYVSQASWVDGEIALFQKAHPHIRINKKTIASGTYPSALELAVQSNTGPDVFMIPATPPIQQQVNQGWLLPLDKWAGQAWRSRFPHGTFLEGSNIFNGKLYSAPLTAHAPAFQLYVNEDVFRMAGLTNADGSIAIPQTWDDVTHAAETIMRKSNGSVHGLGFGNGTFNLLSWWLEVFVRGAGSPGGGYTLDTSNGYTPDLRVPDLRVGKYTSGSDRNYTDFLTLFLEWKRRGYFYPNSMSISDEQARAFFEVGKFGMTVGGVWNEPEWTQHNFTSYSMTTLISPQQTKAGYFYYAPGGTFIAISPHTRHAEEAWEWFDWLYGQEAGKYWVELGEDVSVYRQYNDPDLIRFKPFAQYVQLRIYALHGPDPLVRNPQTDRVVTQPVTPDVGDIVASLYKGQVSDMQGALSDFDGRAQRSLEDGITLAKQHGYNVSIDDYTFPDWDITQPYYTLPGNQS